MSASSSIESLCRQAKNGDMAAASELLRRFYESIFAFFRRLSGSETEAADLTQKTFIKVWNSLASFEERSNFSTWLHSIAWRTFLDWRRKRNPLEFPTDEWWATRQAEGPDPSDHIAGQDEARQVFALVDRLEEGDKTLVHLHYYQGLSLNDTAQITAMPVSTVKHRLRQAIQIIKSQLTERSTQ